MKARSRTLGRLALVLGFVVMLAAAPATAGVQDVLNTGGVAEANTAPSPWIDDPGFTKSAHPMSEGTSHEAVSGIYDDQSVWIPGSESIYTVNRTDDHETGDNVNPYSYEPGHVDDSSHTALENNNGDAWINSANWTKGGTNSSGLTVANATAENGVPGIQFDTGTTLETSNTADAHANFTVSIDTDESKRVLMLGMDVTSLEAESNVTVRIVDESGDYKTVTLNQTQTVTGNNFANSTGDSKVFQIKLNKLATTGGGSFDNIQTVMVEITNADADVTITWLDLRKKAKNDLGEQWATTGNDGADSDGDGEYDEKQTIYNATGSVSVHSMDTLDAEYDDAVINDLSYPVHIDLPSTAVEAEDEDFVVYWEDATDYPNFQHVLNYTVRLEAISYIDANYGANMDLMLVQKWPEGRYISLEVEEGASGSNLSDISGTSKLDKLGSQGDEISDAVKLDDSVSAGSEYLVHFEMTFTDAERTNDIEAGADEDAAAAPVEEDTGGDGILGFGTTGDVVALIGTIVAFLSGIPQRLWRGLMG